MNLLQRVKNIWALSEFKPLKNGEVAESFVHLHSPDKIAKIIRKKEVLDEILDVDKTIWE